MPVLCDGFGIYVALFGVAQLGFFLRKAHETRSAVSSAACSVGGNELGPALANGVDDAVGVEGGVVIENDCIFVRRDPVVRVLVGGLDLAPGGGIDEVLAVERVEHLQVRRVVDGVLAGVIGGHGMVKATLLFVLELAASFQHACGDIGKVLLDGAESVVAGFFGIAQMPLSFAQTHADPSPG